MAGSQDIVRFELKDSFLITGRGRFLAPALKIDTFPNHAELAVELVAPNGHRQSCFGRFQVEHLRLLDGGSKWNGVVILDAAVEKPVVGSHVFCKLVSTGS